MSEAVLGPKSAKYRVFCGYTWKTPVYLENTWVSCRFPQFCPRFCPRPALRLRETREFPEGNSRETEWSTKHPLVSLETSGNAKCWGPSGFPLGCRKPRKGQLLPSFLLSLSVCVCWRRSIEFVEAISCGGLENFVEWTSRAILATATAQADMKGAELPTRQNKLQSSAWA